MNTSTTTSSQALPRVTLADYGKVGAILLGCAAWLVLVTSQPQARVDPQALITPMLALLVLTSVVWLLMGLFRNMAVLRNLVSPREYVAYPATSAAPEWIERPARTFNNLMQVPNLFYLLCVLMMVTHRADRAQLLLCWTYVAFRAAHALVYVGWNILHYRFGLWVASCIVLVTMWTRFALWP